MNDICKICKKEMKKFNTSLVLSCTKNEVYHQKCWEQYNESIGYTDTGMIAGLIDLSNPEGLIVTSRDADGNPNGWVFKE